MCFQGPAVVGMQPYPQQQHHYPPQQQPYYSGGPQQTNFGEHARPHCLLSGHFCKQKGEGSDGATVAGIGGAPYSGQPYGGSQQPYSGQPYSGQPYGGSSGAPYSSNQNGSYPSGTLSHASSIAWCSWNGLIQRRCSTLTNSGGMCLCCRQDGGCSAARLP